ncbi:neuromedin-S [Manis pentadactyla]|uniref:neuromedin-S n=1 Tax=Manis pentadactyla TaxID=143292 RepID=UPI00255C74D9|nr:neuromedin-S [Manis pentadactyla]
MKHLLPQFPPVLALYCFCVLQIPASGFPQSFADPPDGLDIVQLERLAYWATLPTQPKDNQDIQKRFPPVHPLMHLAAKLANRMMKRFLQRVCAFLFHDISMPLKVHKTIINACGCLACILSLILSFCLGRELWPLTLHGFLNLPSLGPLHRDPIGDCRVREGAWSSLGRPFLSCSLHLYVLAPAPEDLLSLIHMPKGPTCPLHKPGKRYCRGHKPQDDAATLGRPFFLFRPRNGRNTDSDTQ